MNYETRLEKADALDAGLDAAPSGSRKWLWIGLALLAAVAVVLWYSFGRTGTDAAPGGEAAAGPAAGKPDAQAQAVTVIIPGRTQVEGTINATGTLAARRELPVGVAGEGGQVVQVLVEAGQWVGAGQVLAVIDRSVQNQQSASQSAQIQVAQADARLAQANLDRALRLVDRGFISKADVDRLTATRDAASARVRVAQAQLGELRARTARLNIVAPAAGLVLERNLEPGQVIGAGSGVLFRMARGGEMELAARLSESDLAALATGVSALVTPVGTDVQFNGQIWQIAPVIDPQTRQGIARIALPYDAALRPGGFATAIIRSGSVSAPLLPESAIQSDAKGSYVYVVGRDNKVARVDVKTGIVTRRGIAIMEGLGGNERIVLRAGGFLAPGEKVNPRVQKPASAAPVAAPAAAAG